MTILLRVRRLGATLGLLATATGCLPRGLSQADSQTGQALIELSDAMTDLREVDAAMQAQIDSLRLVVARQDSALRQIANLAGVPLPPR